PCSPARSCSSRRAPRSRGPGASAASRRSAWTSPSSRAGSRRTSPPRSPSRSCSCTRSPTRSTTPPPSPRPPRRSPPPHPLRTSRLTPPPAAGALGRRGVAAVALAMAGLFGASLVILAATRALYFSLAGFHGYLELAVVAFLLVSAPIRPPPAPAAQPA